MTTGLFGKMPAHGDFVRRGLPRSFVAPWDAWLSQGIEAARCALGEGWEAAWEVAPVWRFRLSPGICGPEAVVGVLATSCDMVGRRFPLTLAAILPGAAVPPPDEWYALLEAALLRAREGAMDADGLAARLPPAPPDDPDATLDGRSLFWCAGLPTRPMPAAADFIRLLDVPATPPQADQGKPDFCSDDGDLAGEGEGEAEVAGLPGPDAQGAAAPEAGLIAADDAPTLPPGRMAAAAGDGAL